MERSPLNDPKVYPDGGVLATHLGRVMPAWEAFAAGVTALFGKACLEWRYYSDGQAWLCKVVHRKKTVCWVSIWERCFNVAFYFTEKNDRDIEALPIPSELKAAYRAHAPVGKLKPLVVVVKTKKSVEPVFVVATYKSGLK